MGSNRKLAALETHLALVNELMPDNNPHGAWALGLLTAHGLKTGRFAPREILDAAAQARSLSEAVAIAQTVEAFTR